MSWHFLPALAVGCWQRLTYSGGAPLPQSRLTRTDARCCFGDSSTVCLTCSPSGTTAGPSTVSRGLDLWMSSLRASPASPSQSPGSDGARTTSATDGPTPSGSFVRYDRDTHSWRTSQACLDLGISDEFSGTWPRRGSMRSGACWERTTLEPRTEGRDSGYWPSPMSGTNRTSNKAKYGRETSGPSRGGPSFGLEDAVMIWPTPRKNDNDQGYRGEGSSWLGQNRGETLSNAVKRWPTPTVDDANNVTRASGDFQSLTRKVNESTGGTLNPNWVEWLMGWPIGYTDLQPLATDKFRPWLHSHGICSTEKAPAPTEPKEGEEPSGGEV